MELSDALDQTFTMISNYALPTLVALAALSSIVMAIIQPLKQIFRPVEYEEQYAKWFTQEERDAFGLLSPVFSLDSKELISYLERRVDALLNYPADNKVALNALGARVHSEASVTQDVDYLIANQGGEPTAKKVAAKQRLRDAIKLTIRNYHLHIDRRWQNLLHILSFELTSIIIVLSLVTYSPEMGFRDYVVTVMVTILGAILAPFARDITKAVEKASK